MIDIGGGSTELVRGARGRIGFHVSTQIGVVRHSERHLRADPPAAARSWPRCAPTSTPRSPPPCPPRSGRRREAAIAVAGTATSCAAIDLALEPYDAARVEGHVLSRAQLEAQLDRLAGAPAGRAPGASPGLHPDRAPTIVAGVAVLVRVLDAFGLDAVEMSDRDILWGAALRLAG